VVKRPKLPERPDRWRRWVLSGQGGYYVITGLWPLLHFSSFTSVVAFRVNPFQAHVFAAVIIVVGGSLLEAARREPPGRFPTMLGIGVASAIALVSLVWLPRLAVASLLWADLAVEVAFAIALAVLYPRTPPEKERTTRRR
jgi:hypothetical protein